MDEGDEGWAGKDEVGVDVGILVGEFSVGIGTVSEGATPCKRTGQTTESGEKTNTVEGGGSTQTAEHTNGGQRV